MTEQIQQNKANVSMHVGKSICPTRIGFSDTLKRMLNAKPLARGISQQTETIVAIHTELAIVSVAQIQVAAKVRAGFLIFMWTHFSIRLGNLCNISYVF